MKNTWSLTKRIIAILALVAAVFAATLFLQDRVFYRADRNQLSLGGFYLEDDQSLDVVLLGSSEVYSGYYAGLAYELEGFTSYPYSYQSNPVTLWPYELREILKHQSPKVLVVEANGAVYDRKQLYKSGHLRKLANNMPFSRNKLELIRRYGTEGTLSYLLPIIKYHGMYFEDEPEKPEGEDGSRKPVPGGALDNRLRLQDKPLMEERGYSLLKGCLTHTQRRKTKPDYDLTTVPQVTDLDPDAEAALNEFLDVCDDSGIEHILFVRFPHQVTAERTLKSYQRYNRTAEIVRARGYEYVDFTEHWDEIGLQKREDFFEVDHLNAFGAEKFTKYLSRYLAEKYDLLPSELTGAQEKEWEESAAFTRQFLKYAKSEIEHFSGADRELEERAEIVRELSENMV